MPVAADGEHAFDQATIRRVPVVGKTLSSGRLQSLRREHGNMEREVCASTRPNCVQRDASFLSFLRLAQNWLQKGWCILGEQNVHFKRAKTPLASVAGPLTQEKKEIFPTITQHHTSEPGA